MILITHRHVYLETRSNKLCKSTNVINFLVSLQCANSLSQSKRTPQKKKKCLYANTNTKPYRLLCLAQVTINSQLMRIWHIPAFESNQGVYTIVRDIFCLIIKHQIPCSSQWCDRTNAHHMFIFSQQNDSPTLYNDYRCPLVNDFHSFNTVLTYFFFWPSPCIVC